MDADDDRALLEAVRRGDARAVETLLARHEKQVYRFGLRMCGSEDAAREVLQETLLAAFRNLGEFRGDASISTWLFQIARSFCIKARRRRVDEPAEHAPLDAPQALAMHDDRPDPEAIAHARQVGEVLQAAILSLPEAWREVLVLRDVEGLSAEEAAKVMGIEVPALKSRLHRARMEVRRHLTTIVGGGADGAARASSVAAEGAGGACPELAEALSEYVTEEIDQSTCVRIEEHMRDCPRCTSACDDLKRTVSLCRSIPGEDVPGPVKAAVRQALGTLALGR